MSGPSIDDLLQRWEDARADGRALTAEDLCRDCPDQLADVRRQLRAVAEMAGMMETAMPAAAGRPAATATDTGDCEAASVDPATPGQRYSVHRPHATGGVGEVLLAHDHVLGRRVALKRIRRHWAGDVICRQRFLREAAITGQLQHPGVVPIYDLITDAHGQATYAMRFIEGESLQAAIDRFHAPANGSAPQLVNRRATFRGLIQRFVSVCNTVAYAHAQGVIHRDLKPANVMLGDYGETLVVDWGLAKRLAVDDGSLSASEIDLAAFSADGVTTREQTLIGTPAFMSPEQASGRVSEVGPASDIFALGAILYTLLTGRPPYTGGAATVVLESAARGEFTPPGKVNPNVPRALEAVCLQAMAPQPEDRYASARELANDVERWLNDEPVVAWREPWPVRSGRWVRRHRTLATTATAVVLAAAMGLGLLAYQNERSRAAVAGERDRAEANVRKAMDGAGYVFAAGYRPTDAPTPSPAEMHREQAELTLEFYRGFLREDSTRPSDRLQTGLVHVSMANVYSLLGDHQRAEEALSHCIAEFESLVNDYPATPVYRIEAAQAHFILGLELHDRGEAARASPEFGRAIGHFREALRLAPDDARALSLTAWFSVVCPDVGLRNAEEAIRCARRSIELNSDAGFRWVALGAAYYRAGNYRDALDALDHSVHLHGGDSVDQFFLAMTHEKLGHHDEARQWYNKARQWRMQRNRTSAVELRLFQAEAKEVLGLAKAAEPASKPLPGSGALTK